MSLLSNESTLKFAKDFTITALEHSFIKSDDDPEKAAENIAVFYKSLVKALKED